MTYFRKRNDPFGEWKALSYAPRTMEHCESLIEYYEGQWGNYYSYRILPAAEMETAVF